MSSLKEQIKEMLKEMADDVQPSEVSTPLTLNMQYDNLILDEMTIEKLTTEDQDYLESFTSLERLSLNQTGLKSLENFPKSEKLVRLELSENKLTGEQLKHLSIYS